MALQFTKEPGWVCPAGAVFFGLRVNPPVGEMASCVELTHARWRGLGRARARSRGAYRLAWGAV